MWGGLVSRFLGYFWGIFWRSFFFSGRYLRVLFGVSSGLWSFLVGRALIRVLGIVVYKVNCRCFGGVFFIGLILFFFIYVCVLWFIYLFVYMLFVFKKDFRKWIINGIIL